MYAISYGEVAMTSRISYLELFGLLLLRTRPIVIGAFAEGGVGDEAAYASWAPSSRRGEAERLERVCLRLASERERHRACASLRETVRVLAV